ncbi:MAG: O-antigen ligase family protein [Nitrospinae bacterium]|nr:O-antigen ligase family protein [Nitrospinota bacterium]
MEYTLGRRDVAPAIFIAISALAGLMGVLLPLETFAYTLAGGAFLAATLFFWRFGLVILMLCLPIETAQIFLASGIYTVKFPVYFFLAILICVAIFLYWRPSGFGPLVAHPMDICLLLVLALEATALVWAPNFFFGATSLSLFVMNVAFYFIVTLTVRSPRDMSRFFDLVIISGVIAASFLFWTAYDEGFTERTFINKTIGYAYGLVEVENRPGGLGGVDQTAGFLAAGFILAFTRLFDVISKWKKYYYVVAGLYVFTGMLLTTARGALVGCVAGIAAFIILHNRTRKWVFTSMTVFGLLTVVMILATKPGFIDRILTGFGYTGTLFFSGDKKVDTSSEGEDSSTGIGARVEWWKKGFAEMNHHPLKLVFGLGPGGFVHYSEAPEVHSVYLSLFFDIGLAGLVILLFAFYFMATSSHKAWALCEDDRRLRLLLTGALAVTIGEVYVHGLIEYEYTSMLGRYPLLYLAMNVAMVNIIFKLRGANKKAVN